MATDPHYNSVELLLKFDGANDSTTFIDSSPNPKTMSVAGSAKISTAQSKWGASGYFGGSTDIRTPIAPFAFPGDFTVEAWVFPLTGADNVVSGREASPTTGISVRVVSNKLTCFYGGGLGAFASTAAVPSSAWTHIAVSRSGSTARFFINGVLVGYATWSGTINNVASGNLQIGRYGSSEAYSGYIDDLRITKGVARYTANFTPPVETHPTALPTISGMVYDSVGAPAAGRTVRVYRRDTGALVGSAITSDGAPIPDDVHYASTKLLLHFNGADGSTTFTDSSPVVRAPTVAGAAKIGTAQSAFGGSSGNFTIAGSSIEYASSADFEWASASYTVELSAYITSYGSVADGTPRLIGVADLPGNVLYWGFGPNSSGKLTFYYWSGAQQKFIGSSTVPLNQWVHLSMSFDGTYVRLFVNGVLDGTFAYSAPATASGATPFRVGFSSGAGGAPCAFFCDELRITKGVARHTANFTPPTAPYPNPGDETPGPEEGSYTIQVPHAGEVQRVVLDDDAGTLYNDLLDRVIIV